MFKKNLKIVLILLCLSLTACGFKLRSEAALPPQIRVLYIQSDNPYGDFELRLKKTLRTLGITIVEAPMQAPITLKIINTNLSYYPTSIGTSNQATIYNVVYSMSFSLLDNKGKTLLAPQAITSVTTLTLSANQVISNNNQLYLLTQQLQRDTITRLIGILSSEKAVRAMQHKIPAHEKS